MLENKLRIGTRGSRLARVQTQLVADALMKRHPGLEIETVIISTRGDKNFDPIPLDTVGKAWFTAEIDRALATGEIDLAVHSLKDLPLEIDPQLTLLTVLERDDAGDTVVSRSGSTLAELPAGAVIGTDSSRRGALVRHARPDLVVRSLRGNVQTRLRKLREQDYDAIILAAAGLNRLGQLGEATEMLDPTTFVPSPGQGVLAVEARSTHAPLLEALRALGHPATVVAATAERSFSATVGGGCKLPIGCYAAVSAGNVTIHGLVADPDGPGLCLKSTTGPADHAARLAADLARAIMAECGFSFHPA